MNNNQAVSIFNSDLNEAIDKGINFLANEQLEDGEFITYVNQAKRPNRGYEYDSTPFTNCFVVYSLSFYSSPQIDTIINKALDFFTSHMESTGVWRFWSFKNRRHLFIPPDMDDTCCISYLLKKYRKPPDNIDLIFNSRNREGLFYTWFLPSFNKLKTNPLFWLRSSLETPIRYNFWRKTFADYDDIDGGVNANVLLYLGETTETKPIIDYLIDIISNNKEESCDKWYATKFPFYYLVSRPYYEGVKSLEAIKDKIIDNIQQGEKELLANPLDASLAACTMMNFNYSSPLLNNIIQKLIQEQKKEGNWDRVTMYYGDPKKNFGWGSKELTTGFCLEALTRYQLIQ